MFFLTEMLEFGTASQILLNFDEILRSIDLRNCYFQRVERPGGFAFILMDELNTTVATSKGPILSV